MRKETSRKIKNFTLDVIDIFLGIPESLVMAFDRKEFYRLLNGDEPEHLLTCANIAKLISNMKGSGYVQIEKKNGQESIKFTNKARLAIVDRIAKRSDADDRHHFVSFDIPEKMRPNRDKFRRTIKRIGFSQIQESLWVCRREVGDLVELAAREYGVDEYVVYIVSDNTNINNTILKMFSHGQGSK